MILPSAGVGNGWMVNSFTGRAGGAVVGNYTNVMATLTIYRTVNLSGSGVAFSNPFGSVTRNIGSFFTATPGVGTDFTMSNLGIFMSAGPSDPAVGYGIKVSFSATGPGVVTPHYQDGQSTVPGSSSSQGWYRDLNDNGILQADEYEIFGGWSQGNLMFELDATATPVPEPVSGLALLLPLSVLAARRRRARQC